jgi:outer membrane protein OmpA-like peptidoglycan-associated protein
MNVRRWAALAIVVVAATALGVLHFLSSPPTVPSTTADTPNALGTPTATANAIVSVAPSSAEPSPSPSPSSNPNLLRASDGAFVRSWTVGGLQDDPQSLAQENGTIAFTPSFGRPVELLYELPAIAHIDAVGVTLRGAKPAGVAVAIGTDVRNLRDVGSATIVLPAGDDTERSFPVAADARFVRITVMKTKGHALSITAATANGTPGAPERGALGGFWLNLATTTSATRLTTRGRIPDTAPSADRNDDQRAAVIEDGHVAWFRCGDRYDPWQATLDDGVARGGVGALQLAGNGNLLVGNDGNQPILAIRAKALPACGSSAAGSGPIVAAFVRVLGEDAPEIDPAAFPGFRFETHFAPTLEASQLRHARFALLDGDCSASSDLSPRRQKILLDWVGAGHKLVIRDADMCSRSDYTFVPYRFSTKATGALGRRGHVLEIADPSTLGATRGDPAHFLDAGAYLASDAQQLGDADIMKTDDSHWCGHLFATNALNVNGWVHAYARYGRGLIIYDGFDRDDLKASVPAARRVVQLEYAQPAQADLPCNARVASELALYPSVDRTLPVGKAVDLRVSMHLVSTATGPQDVALSIDGDRRFEARVMPTHVRLSGSGSHAVTAAVSLPNGWSGSHAYTVEARGAYGASAQASIFIDGSIALAKAFESERRVRLYGIHFDVASARIQPVSESTIAQIAQVLAAHPDWTMRVEGHTDSDGGASYNLDLSVQRARAVVDDLVTRYHVNRGRLHAAGFGLTKPVASNQTEAGKALNRRVELVRL